MDTRSHKLFRWLVSITLGLLYFPIALSSVISPDQFGVNKTIIDFEDLQLTETFATPVQFNGITLDAGAGVLRYETHEDCVSGYCIGTQVSSDYVYIDFQNPVNRVGIYLGGTLDPLEQGMTLYDENHNIIESFNGAFGISNNLYFIGMESLSIPVYSIRLRLSYGLFSSRFDDLTIEAVPIPAAAWLFGSGLIGLIGLIGVAKRKKV